MCFYVNEVTSGKLLGNQRIGLVARGIGGLELSDPSPDFLGEKRGWNFNQSPMASDLISHA